MVFYDFIVKDRYDNSVSLREYKNKVVIVINTATKCGFTPQYTALQKLYAQYEDKGLTILDFPCNQFLSQAKGTDKEINNFCILNFGTQFPRFSKVDVNGKNAHPLFVWLKEQAPTDIVDKKSSRFERIFKIFTLGNKPSDIKWNFCKFLIDRNGNIVARYSPAFLPENMEETIKALL